MNEVAHSLRVEGSWRWRRENRCPIGVRRRKPVTIRPERPDNFWIAVHDPILPVDTTAEVGVEPHVRIVDRGSYAARQPSLELSDTAKLPAAECLAGKTRLVFEERKLIEIIDDHDV